MIKCIEDRLSVNNSSIAWISFSYILVRSSSVVNLPQHFYNMQDDSKIKDLFVFFASSKFKHAFREHLHFLAAQCSVSPARLLSKFFTDEGTLHLFPVAWCTPYLKCTTCLCCVCWEILDFKIEHTILDFILFTVSTFKQYCCLTTILNFMFLFSIWCWCSIISYLWVWSSQLGLIMFDLLLCRRSCCSPDWKSPVLCISL